MPEFPPLLEHEIRPFRTRPATLVTAPSYLLDRFVPDCEIVSLPAKDVAGGLLRHGLGPLPPAPRVARGRLSRFLPRRAPAPAPALRGPAIDLRRNTPENWAHFLNNHLPLFFRLAALHDLDPRTCSLVLPARTPPHIVAAAALFGLDTCLTDGDVRSEGLLFDLTPWTAMRAERPAWVRGPQVQATMAGLSGSGRALPRRLFLSRRGTRALSNEAEVAGWLARAGFEKVFPEDLGAADQFLLFREAEIIVAIHGAGLAPMLYDQPGIRLRQLVELLPCGHMTDVYRVMADQIGCGWIGVRGRIEPKHVRPAYDAGKPFTAFSLDPFEVDLRSLEEAFRLAEIRS